MFFLTQIRAVSTVNTTLMSNFATVVVTVVDANDHAPVFNESSIDVNDLCAIQIVLIWKTQFIFYSMCLLRGSSWHKPLFPCKRRNIGIFWNILCEFVISVFKRNTHTLFLYAISVLDTWQLLKMTEIFQYVDLHSFLIWVSIVF